MQKNSLEVCLFVATVVAQYADFLEMDQLHIRA